MPEKVAVGSDDEKKENYGRFMQFFEAVVAYHRYRNPGR